jgi:hypothetical protein
LPEPKIGTIALGLDSMIAIARIFILLALTHISIAHGQVLQNADLSKFKIFSLLYSADSNQILVGVSNPSEDTVNFASCRADRSGHLVGCTLANSLWIPAAQTKRLSFQFRHNLRMAYAGAQIQAGPTAYETAKRGFTMGLQAGVLPAFGVKPVFVGMIIGAELAFDGSEPVPTHQLPQSANEQLERVLDPEQDFPVFTAFHAQDEWLTFDLVRSALFVSLAQL